MEDIAPSAPFRTVSTPATELVEQVPQGKREALLTPEKVDVAPGLTIYEEVNGVPYTADFFRMGAFMESPDMPDTKSDIRSFEEFVRGEIKGRGMTDTKEAYEEVVKAMENDIGADENEAPTERFRRLSAAAKAIQRLRSLSKKPLLNGSNLQTAEFEMIYGGRRG
jgi:hypothetical protein